MTGTTVPNNRGDGADNKIPSRQGLLGSLMLTERSLRFACPVEHVDNSSRIADSTAESTTSSPISSPPESPSFLSLPPTACRELENVRYLRSFDSWA